MLAISQALSWSLALIGLFGVVFPLLVFGLLGFGFAQGLGERAQNQRGAGRWGRRAERQPERE
ncbi:MAG: hypothetical protein H0U79_07520 [Solirubrobacterales bacterium]|nr:hypothetical protein [Solirubrobacterales bacterium]